MAVASLLKVNEWQNSIRAVMEMEPLEAGYAVEIVLLALVVFAVLFLLGRGFRASFNFFDRWISNVAPRRIALALGALLALVLFWSVAQGVLFSVALRILDSSFRELDALVEYGAVAPADPAKTGSPASLLDWGGLGRQGHRFVLSGPSKTEIETLAGAAAMEPIRVYAGLNSARDGRGTGAACA